MIKSVDQSDSKCRFIIQYYLIFVHYFISHISKIFLIIYVHFHSSVIPVYNINIYQDYVGI